MANVAASGEPLAIPASTNGLGGCIRCDTGSAVDQNRMPMAMVVQIVIENQFHLLINGRAPGPPIRTWRNLEKQMSTDKTTDSVAHATKSQPNRSSTQLLAVVTVRLKAPASITFLVTGSCLSGARKFRTMAASNSKKGGQKTKGFSLGGRLAASGFVGAVGAVGWSTAASCCVVAVGFLTSR